jgi:succinyl-diaminopimelate desuccinylase
LLRSTLDRAGGGYELALELTGESFLSPPGPFTDLVIDAVEAATGVRPEPSTTGGTSDARFIHRLCPVVEFGLTGQTMHKVDENVPVADILALSDIYHGILARYFAR